MNVWLLKPLKTQKYISKLIQKAGNMIWVKVKSIENEQNILENIQYYCISMLNRNRINV